MPRAKVGRKYIIVKDFKKFPKEDYTENFLEYDNGKLGKLHLANSEGDKLSFGLRDKMPRLADQLPKAIKRGNDLMFPIPEDKQVIKLASEAILGLFVYRKKIYTISYPIYKPEDAE